MKIIHVITDLGSGGAERMLSKLVNLDKKNDHIIVTILKGNVHYEFGDIKIIELNLKNNLFNKLKCIYFLRNIIKNEKPDIIQTWMKCNFYGPLLKNNKTKIISNFRNGFLGSNNKLLITFFNLYFTFFDGNIFVSESSLVERVSIGMKFKNSIIINNGFSMPNTYRELSTKEELVFGHVGRYYPLKNQQLIIDAFQEFSDNKDVKLIMLGRNLNEHNLTLNDNLPNKVFFKGETNDLDKFYLGIDALILVSSSEGFPNVIGEAMSYGIPVIASDAGESHKVIGETGYKIFKPNKQDLIAIFEEIYMNRTTLINKGVKARKKIQKEYSLNQTISNYQNYYNSIGDL